MDADTARWIAKILEGYRAGLVPLGRVTRATILHDDDCPFLDRRGQCTCEPDVEFSWDTPLTGQQ